MRWWTKALIFSVIWVGVVIAVGYFHTEVFLAGQVTPAQDEAISEGYGTAAGLGLVVVWAICLTRCYQHSWGKMPLASSIGAAIAVFAGIISGIVFAPITHAQQDELNIGKYRVTADFPCHPKRIKKLIGKTETSDGMPLTVLVCSQGAVTYSLSATEYPEQTLKTLTADAWANATLDGMRSQPHYALKSSSQLSYQKFPAIRMHFLDSRVPPLDTTRLSVLTDAGVIVIGGSWPSGSPEPSPSATFTNSLAVTSVKN